MVLKSFTKYPFVFARMPKYPYLCRHHDRPIPVSVARTLAKTITSIISRNNEEENPTLFDGIAQWACTSFSSADL